MNDYDYLDAVPMTYEWVVTVLLVVSLFVNLVQLLAYFDVRR